MIELYRTQECKYCEEIEEALKEMVIAHKVFTVSSALEADFPKNVNLPAIKDDKKIIFGKKEIEKYLEELKDYLSEWNKFQSDSCYIEKDGSTC